MRSEQSSAASTSVTRSSPDVVATIEDTLARFGVVFFTGQELDVEGHAALATALGRPKLPPEYIPTLAADGHPEICVLSTDNQLAYASSLWHSDVTWAERPPKYSILHMQVSPAVGGDTMWSSQHVAFETLSAPMQAFLESLTAIISIRSTPASGPIIRSCAGTR